MLKAHFASSKYQVEMKSALWEGRCHVRWFGSLDEAEEVIRISLIDISQLSNWKELSHA